MQLAQLAWNFLSLLPETRVVPGLVTCIAAISAYGKGGLWQLALTLLSLMPEAMVVPSEIAYGAAAGACRP